MNIQKTYTSLISGRVRKSEGVLLLKKYLKMNDTITFFSWKLFPIDIQKEKILFNPNFDVEEANKYVKRELLFLSKLKKAKIMFNYVKIIPDELTYYFWGTNSSPAARKYSSGIRKYFNRYVQTEVYLMSDFLREDRYRALYESIYSEIVNSFDEQFKSKFVSKSKFEKEVAVRAKMYGYKKGSIAAKKIAIKAFALFSAETSLLFRLAQDKKIPNLVLLAGARSVDTYKYEFYKSPTNRPTIPKIFVL